MAPDKIATVRRVIENDRESCLEQLDNQAINLIDSMQHLRRRITDAKKTGGYYVGYHSGPINASAEIHRLLVKLQSVEERARELAYLTDETKGGAA